ncbi:MAG TPA: leucine--tRNA ligase, partial [candidate division WWE3 bacterium]|nr:leucine--tRNA ligase [candidate division WWE3 bacterium]
WNPRGVLGVKRFLDKVWRAHQEIREQEKPVASGELKSKLHRLVKKVEEGTLNLKFNTVVSFMMEFINELSDARFQLSENDWKAFLKILAPYAPHLAEELWHDLGGSDSVHLQNWPKYDPKLLAQKRVTVVVQVNGKLRGKLEIEAGGKEKEVVAKARNLENVRPHLHGRKVAKTVFIPDNLVNFVIS